MVVQENPGKSRNETLEGVLAHLTPMQIRYVIVRQECATDKEAAEAIGIKPDTVYHWPQIVREAVRLMARDGVVTALHLRRRALSKAMLVKVDGLDSKDERVRQAAATELIEWELGRAAQTNKNEHSGHMSIDIEDYRAELERRLSGLIGRGQTEGVSEQSEPG